MDKPFKAFTKYTAGVVRFIRRPQYTLYDGRSISCITTVVQRVWHSSYNVYGGRRHTSITTFS